MLRTILSPLMKKILLYLNVIERKEANENIHMMSFDKREAYTQKACNHSRRVEIAAKYSQLLSKLHKEPSCMNNIK